MILDLMNMPEQPMRNFKGGDGIAWVRMFNDEHNRIAMIRLQPGCSIGMHTHETNSEIMHVLSGSARIVMEDHIEHVSAGQVHYCPQGHAHMTEPVGTGDLVVLVVIPEHA